jgi:hypothetical protein
MKFNLFTRKSKKDISVSVGAVAGNIDISRNHDDYSFVFNDISQESSNCETVVFGDLTSSHFSDTLTVYQNGKPVTKLDLRHDDLTWNKKRAVKFHQFIAIGLSGFFYLYDLSSSRFVIFINFSGYFCDLQTTEDYLVVAYHSGMYCLTKYGQIKWHNSQVGLDGITIERINGNVVYGCEQIDPPDGWRDFVIDLVTGMKQE